MQLDTQPNVSDALIRLLSRQIGVDKLRTAYEARQVTVMAPWARGHDTVHRVNVAGETFDIPTVEVLNEIYDPEEVR